MPFTPSLEERDHDGLRLLWDPRAAQAGCSVAFTNRRGGVSESPFESLNLSFSTGDDRSAVTENRSRAALAAGFDTESLALGRQAHGVHVHEAATSDTGVVGECDALIARGERPTVGILTADCGPVVVAGETGVAVLHAGWRGLVAGVVERGVALLGTPLCAWIGPCIRSCCYEVGPEVVAAFHDRSLPVADARHVDIASGAEAALRRAGVDRIAVSERCTCCDPDYYSYRRDGVTGRQGAFARRATT